MQSRGFAIALGMTLTSTVLPASALTFNVTYDASVSSAPAGFQTAFQDAINVFQSTFATPIAININVGWGEVGGTPISGGLAASNTSYVLENYSTVSAALSNINPQYTLPNSHQISGKVGVATADATALGLSIGSLSSGGSVGFSSSAAWNYTANTAVSGEYNFVAAAEHEISEVMGRFSTLNPSCTSNCSQSVLDLFRYTAAGTLDHTGTSAYFSTNGGVTSINSFNGNPNAGDLGDWAGVTLDAFNYAGSPGTNPPFSSGDITELNALGYTLIAPVPLPMSGWLMGSGLLAFMGFVKRRQIN